MTQNHTPGPWQTSRDGVPDGYVQVTIYAESTGNRVATAFECEANARLIAAAPDLLAALREIADSEQPADSAMGPAWVKAHEKFAAFARAAIAKVQP